VRAGQGYADRVVMRGGHEGKNEMHNVFAQVSDWPKVCRRAGGRRHYNQVRQFRAVQRRARLASMLRKEGLGWGYQTRMAAKLGVSPSTISRDITLLRVGLKLPTDHNHEQRARTALDRRAKAEAKAVETDEECNALPEMISRRDVPATSSAEPCKPPMQVPRWVPTEHGASGRYPESPKEGQAAGQTPRRRPL
jgi:hypothetical protein